MKLNTYLIILVFKIIFINLSVIAEPMVVLEYSNNNDINELDGNDHNNKNFSTHHKIKKNETLSNIIQKYYGNKGLNLTFVQAAILHKNKSAFVRSNPNFMYAQKRLYLPSIREIQDLVYSKKRKSQQSESQQLNKEIYFFGN